MNDFTNCLTTNAQQMKFSIKNFFGKCVQNRRKLRIWPPLLKKSLIKNFIFCAVYLNFESSTQIRKSDSRSICNKNSSWKILEELIRKNFFAKFVIIFKIYPLSFRKLEESWRNRAYNARAWCINNLTF